MTYNKKVFLSLLRLGIGHEAEIPERIDWESIKKLADSQGLAAIVFDGASRLYADGLLSEGRSMDLNLKQKWIATVIQAYEFRYADYRKCLGQLAEFYNSHGFKLMVLKGYGLSLDYPVPNHRPVGDMDIWAFGEYKRADEALHKELGIAIDTGHHHHTVFSWKGYMVENHYDWVNVHAHKSSAAIEEIFKRMAMDDSNHIEVEGQRVYLPSPNLHALFMLRHSVSHFASTSMNLRQVLDWAFFAEKNTDRIDWKWLQETLGRFHMLDFFMNLNDICVRYLGFSPDIFPTISADPGLSGRILGDMLSPEFSEELPSGSGVIRRVLFKFRRWRSNAWKRRLCYEEGPLVSFFVSAWAHLLKPSSI